MTNPTRDVQCPRTINAGHDRCPWRGPLNDFPAHTADIGHQACVVCTHPLGDDETRTCHRCVSRAELDLVDIATAYALLPDIVEHSGYRMGGLPGGDALVMYADGSQATPQTPNAYTRPVTVAPTVHIEHPEIPGHTHTHPAYIEERVPSDGREHVRDHWKIDPSSVLAVLEAHERGWRRHFHHRPADDIATVTSTVGYLTRWLPTAARTHPEFDEYVLEIRQLHSRLMHVTGIADDPQAAPAECFDCGGRLQRAYRPLRVTVPDRIAAARTAVADDERRIVKHYAAEAAKHPDRPEMRARPRVPARASRVRHAVTGAPSEGLDDTLTCTRCKRTYDPAEYGLLLRSRANSVEGWVTVRVAAETLRRHEQVVWRWVHNLDVPSACSVDTRRVVVDWEQVQELSAATQRRANRVAS